MVKSNRQNRKVNRKKETEVPIDRKKEITHEESKAQNNQTEDKKMSENQNTSFVTVSTIKCELDRKTTEQEIAERAESIKNVGLIHSVKIQPVEDKKSNIGLWLEEKAFWL